MLKPSLYLAKGRNLVLVREKKAFSPIDWVKLKSLNTFEPIKTHEKLVKPYQNPNLLKSLIQKGRAIFSVTSFIGF